MNKTSIEWVKNPDGTQGYTWNPITGCLNGCEYCYARKLANGRLRDRYLANHDFIGGKDLRIQDAGRRGDDPFYPRFWDERVRENFGAWSSGAEPKGIFVCDMSDLFGIGIPEEWTGRILAHIGMSWYREHRFYLLTKQPQNLPQWSPFPGNCWVGVTATNFDMSQRAISFLKQIDAKVKYISYEPLLDKVTLHPLEKGGIDWVIIGAQTKPYKPPKIEGVSEIVEACDKAGIPVFLKNNLYPLLGLGNGKSICHNNWNGTLRQELPQ